MKNFIRSVARVRNKAGIVLFILCLITLGLPSMATSQYENLPNIERNKAYSKALSLYKKGKYAEAFEIAKPLADRGNR